MNNKATRLIVVALGLLLASLANATTDWSAQDYDLYPGDFNGDGKTDILYIAKSPDKLSGVAISDSTGAPNSAWQSWPSNYLGVQWYGGLYSAIVADFNHDSKADILLQRTSSGDSFLLLTDSTGHVTDISQAIGQNQLISGFSKDQHVLLAGDFNGDGRADLFSQATSASGTNGILLADGSGMFTASPSPTQSWTDSSWPAFKWSTQNALISAGDFNGDGKADLLIQAKPKIVMIDYEIPIPVPVYSLGSFGVVLWTSTVLDAVVQNWNRNDYNADWSPTSATAVVSDFNGDGLADVLLQAKNSSKQSVLVTRNPYGTAFNSGTIVSSNVPLSVDSARVLTGNFDGSGGVGIYVQAQAPSGTNYVANTVGASVSASVHDPAAVTGVVPATAVGKTNGSFAVSSNGAATYSIPIIVPPGIQGMQPNLALTYSSQAGNGSLGVGWTLSGLSQIAICAATPGSDGITDFGGLQRICVDGNKLHQTSQPHSQYATLYSMQAGDTFETELQTFSKTTAYLSPDNRMYFKIQRKDGLEYEYGANDDSYIEQSAATAPAVPSPVPYLWLLDKVTDRAGNTMTMTYQEDGWPNGAARPLEINYTSNVSAGVPFRYQVKFIWETRPESDYVTDDKLGSYRVIHETQRLHGVETYYNGALVRKYQLSYELSGVSQRSKLTSVQECSGSSACLAPTTFAWQESGLGSLTMAEVTGPGRSGAGPDLLTTVIDGLGNQLNVNYAAIDYIPPTYLATYKKTVVANYQMTDGTGGQFTVSELFSDPRMDSSRGFLGFGYREETDQRTGWVRHFDYVHHSVFDPSGLPTLTQLETMGFPYTGRASREWLTQADGTMVTDTTYTYATLWRATPTVLGYIGEELEFTPPVVLPYTKLTVQKQYEVGGTSNGLLLSQTTTTVNAMDDYGNATDATTTVEDQDTLLAATDRTFTTRVVQTITNDTANWCLGRPSSVQTTSTLGNGTSRTQTESRTIDYQHCRITDKASESGTPAQSVATHYDYATAACGNASAVTVTGHRSDGSALTPRITSFGFGAACNLPVSITDPMGKVTTRTYDYALGVLKSETDPNGRVMQADYDAFARRIKTTNPDGTSTTVAFTACNIGNSYCGVADLRMRVDTVQRDTGNNPIRASYTYLDSLGRTRIDDEPLPITGALSHVVSTYDSFGRLSSRTVPYSSSYQGKTIFGYDLAGRQLSAKLYDANGTVVRQSSARYEGRRVVSVDPRGYETEKVSDVLGQLRQVKDPTSSLNTVYGYSFSGSNLVSTVTDKAGNQIITTTNLAGNKISSQDPDMGAWSFEYTSFGELTKQTDAKGQWVTFGDYDALGRPTMRREYENASTYSQTDFTYGTTAEHAYGQLKSISSGGYTETYDFDTLGRSSATHIQIPGEPQYDINYDYQTGTGLIDTVTYPVSTSSTRLKVKYDYSQGVQTSVRDYTNNTLGTTYWQLTAIDAMGHATTEQLGNGIKVVTGYDSTTGLMSSRQSGTDGGATNRQNLSYLWDASGNLQRRTDNNQAGLYERFYYDALNRLDYSTLNGNTNLDMTYNEIGNITYKSDVGNYAYPTSGANSVRPHAVTTAGSGSYSYDANGNMTARPGATVTWYSDNSVKKITQGSVSSEFWYSPSGDRFKQQAVYSSGTETTYYIGGVMEKVVLASGTAYRHYISAGSSTIVHTRSSAGNTQTNYVITDHLGSSSAITDQAGALVANESFDAFGKRRGSNWTGVPTTPEMQAIANVTRDGFTGHEHLDNLGLIHMNGRVQDPTLGRFLSADPFIQAPEYSQSLNRYSYVWNNPLNMTDPSGFDGVGEGCPGGVVQATGGADAICHGGSRPPVTPVCEFGSLPLGSTCVQLGEVVVTARLPDTCPPGALCGQGAQDFLRMQREAVAPVHDRIAEAINSSIENVIERQREDLGNFPKPITGEPPLIGPLGNWVKGLSILQRIRAMFGAARGLKAADFGAKATFKALEGTIKIEGKVATVSVRNMEGNLGNAWEALNALKDTARAGGATSLRIEGTIANPALLRAMERMLGPATPGALGGAQDIWMLGL